MFRHPTTTSNSAATMLHALLAAGALLVTTTRALAHEDPPGCFQTGPAIVTTVFRADGTTALVGAVSECETIHYRAALMKAVDDDTICAFSGGTFALTTPDGVVHTIEANVPCVGGTTAPCDPGVRVIQSALVPYTVRPADVAGGLILATATYTSGTTHDSELDTAGITAATPKATVVVVCDDGDACTQNVCDPNAVGGAACSNPPVDCADANACTTDACSEGECTHVAPDPTCVPCETAADCNDQNACTTDACSDGICVHTTPDPTCIPCDEPGDCGDGNACTTDLCVGGICGHETPEPTCVPCDEPGDCGDGNACTTDLCVDGICAHETPDPACVPCETAADCNDENVCTTERCTDGVCGHTAVPGCIPCRADDDCDDRNACTTDACGEDRSCQITTIPGCVPCETATQCDDGDACTTDACPAGACAHAPVAGCPAEICDDRIDNDGDGAIDCVDPDCEGNAACPPELCGNCLDDDGDGAIDYEDADCCDDAANLDLRRLAVRTKPGAGKNRLRVKARYASRAPDGFDPGLLGTTLQLRDDDGMFFCQNIPFKSGPLWTRMGLFKFKDKTGTMAAGLRKARFKIHRKTDGHVSFRTKGKKMGFREPAGSDVQVTLRVGTQCTQATASLKTKRARKGKRLVFP
jgi:hypothetical protein